MNCKINATTNIPYYPEYRERPAHNKEDRKTFETIVRKKYEGIWYCWLVRNWHEERLHWDVYCAMIMGTINPELKFDVDIPVFAVDDLQIEESERLSKILRL